jgi:hypothetical protein
MNYCVKKGTSILIEGSTNPIEIITQNATSRGFVESEIEIITEEEYQVRKANEPVPPEREIKRLKTELAETDYKIIKCYEYQLAGQELPYDIQELHTERQALRDQINELELALS